MWNEEELCGKDDLCPTWLRNWYQVSHRTAQNFDIVPLWLSHFHHIECNQIELSWFCQEYETYGELRHESFHSSQPISHIDAGGLCTLLHLQL